MLSARRFVLFCSVPAVLVLTGCTVGYTADVRNDTAQPIVAYLVRGDSSGQSNALALQRIGPNSRGELSRYNVPDGWKIYLQVDAQGNPGYPAQLDVLPGLSVVRVTQDGNLPTGKMRLERVSRD